MFWLFICHSLDFHLTKLHGTSSMTTRKMVPITRRATPCISLYVNLEVGVFKKQNRKEEEGRQNNKTDISI